MEQPLMLHCWVYGTDVSRIFLVEISKTKTVAALRKAIRDEKPVVFGTVDANTLDIYPIAFDDDVDDERIEHALNMWNVRHETKKVKGRTKLSKLFPEVDNKQWVVIVKAPISVIAPAIRSSATVLDITLLCWVRGQHSRDVFSVKISKAETVDILRITIKNEKRVQFRDVDANQLALYKVSLPCDKDLEQRLDHLELDAEQLLDPQKTLSNVFSDAPLPEHLHIVIEAYLSSESSSSVSVVASLP
ncbi:hypothetical protein ID866_10116 [Astraeus odoratus]|nr:hypothetical protein ID866_10116 [Astraeus odoratus]